MLVTFSSILCFCGSHSHVDISRVCTWTGTLLSSCVLSVLFVRSHDSASGTCCLMPARCKKSNSDSDKRSRHRFSFPEAPYIVMSRSRASWYVVTVNQLHSRYGRSNDIAHTTVNHSLCVVVSLRSESPSTRGQYPIGLSVPSSYVWRFTHPIYVSQTSVSVVYCPFARGRTSIGGFVGAFFERIDRL